MSRGRCSNRTGTAVQRFRRHHQRTTGGAPQHSWSRRRPSVLLASHCATFPATCATFLLFTKCSFTKWLQTKQISKYMGKKEFGIGLPHNFTAIAFLYSTWPIGPCKMNIGKAREPSVVIVLEPKNFVMADGFSEMQSLCTDVKNFVYNGTKSVDLMMPSLKSSAFDNRNSKVPYAAANQTAGFTCDFFLSSGVSNMTSRTAAMPIVISIRAQNG
mmetsp:Transcript_88383/g.172826  ORF Transcript_88383/g.172826 Transcript_88383/m.172826 type:complete len:215 (-) Transcript_88383:717-1361(-)